MTSSEPTSKAAPIKERLRGLLRPLGYVLLGLALFQWFGRASSGPKEGTPAEEFTLTLAQQPPQQISLAALRGQPAVIEVFASWCKACRAMAPTMADLAKATRQREVRFLGVAIDTPLEEALAMHQAWGIPFSVALADSTFASNYQIKVLPTVIVLDADGRVRHVTTGSTRSSTIDGWLEELGAARSR
jgi:cytochrome c biogenesis protein CcmG, thiol:disulfide interchange protein DsbE